MMSAFACPVAACEQAALRWRALQELRDELLGAKHLVSVSGGGYTAGAFAPALTAAGPPPGKDEMPTGEIQRARKHAFAAGSIEEDHIRRHSSYLANTLPELVVALGLMLRHFLLSLFVLFAPAVVAGVLAEWFYKYVPIADLSGVNARQSSASYATPFNTFRVQVLVALALVVVVALVLWLSHQWAMDHDPRSRAVAWACVHVRGMVRGRGGHGNRGAAGVASAVVGAVLTVRAFTSLALLVLVSVSMVITGVSDVFAARVLDRSRPATVVAIGWVAQGAVVLAWPSVILAVLRLFIGVAMLAGGVVRIAAGSAESATIA